MMKKITLIAIASMSLLNFWILEGIAEVISGTVRDDSGNLLSKVMISVENAETRTRAGLVYSDQNGEFALKVYPGVYDLTAIPTSETGLKYFTIFTRSGIEVTEDMDAVENIELRDELGKIKQYAPIIWLANDERLYPVMPHPFAFDGIDNDGDGSIDLQDPEEVSMDECGIKDLVRLVEELRKLELDFSLDILDMLTMQDMLNLLAKLDMQEMQEISRMLRIPDPSKDEKELREELREELTEGTWSESEDRLIWGEKEKLKQELKGKLREEVRERLKITDGLNKGEIPAELLRHFQDKGILIPKSRYHIKDKGKNRWELTKYDKDTSNVLNGHRQTYTITDHGANIAVQRKMLPPARVIYYTDPAKCDQRVKGTQVYQYWFYYLFDEGFSSHEHDGEHAFVFVDMYTGKVKGVVGAGHTSATANNILVVGDPLRTDRRFPTSLPNHMPILVELGKHASAPDRNLDGRFDLGMDANQFPDYAWGSRDIMTATDTVRIGEFRQEYSYPRNKRNLIFEESWRESSYLESYYEDYRDYHEQKPQPILKEEMFKSAIQADVRQSYRTEAEARPDLEPPPFLMDNDDRPELSEGYQQQFSERDIQESVKTYSLFPLEDMRKLYDLLAEVKRDNYAEKKEEIRRWLDLHKSRFWGERAPDRVYIDDDAFEKMMQWTKNKKKGRDLWLKDDHKKPNDIFKLWLFPRLALEFALAKDQHSDWKNITTGIGLRYSNPISRWPWRNPIGIYIDHNWFDHESDISIIYNWTRGVHLGLYGGFGWGNLSRGGFRSRNCLLVNLGGKFSWDVSFLGHTQAVLSIGVRGEIHGPESSKIDPIDPQIRLGFTKSLIGPKHPLTY